LQRPRESCRLHLWAETARSSPIYAKMSQVTDKTGPKRPPRGSYAVTVDATGRFKFPAAYKEYLESLEDKTIFITAVFGLIRGYTNDSWEQALSKLAADAAVQKAVWEDGDRFGQDMTPDGQGRATLPQKVRDAVKLDLTNGTTLQMRFHGEVIWMYTQQQWAQMEARNDANQEALRAAAEKLGLV